MYHLFIYLKKDTEVFQLCDECIIRCKCLGMSTVTSGERGGGTQTLKCENERELSFLILYRLIKFTST